MLADSNTNSLSNPQTTRDDLFGAIPLSYTYLIKSDSTRFLYQSNTGLWREIDAQNTLIASQLPESSRSAYRIIDNFGTLRSDIQSKKENLSICDSRGNDQLLHLKIGASGLELPMRHTKVLQNYHKVDFKTLLVDKGKFKKIFTNRGIAQEFQDMLDQVAKFCEVEIVVSKNVEHFNVSLGFEAPSDLIDQNIYIYILGDTDNTTFAETRLRLILDNELDLFIDSVDVPLSAIPLVGGVSFGDFRAIALETGVNIYLPSLLPELYKNDKKQYLDVIYLSGLESQVLLSKKLIQDVIEKKTQNVLYKNISVLKFKRDSILMNKKEEVSAIMYKHGVFIQSPPLGSDESLVHFQGTSADLIERAIVDFTSLSNEILFANIWFHKDSTLDASGLYEPADLSVSTGEIQELVSRISIASNVSIYTNIHQGSFEIWGAQEDILKAIKLFSSYSKQLYNDFQCAIELKVELGLSYHEFISGKKNGKISKIMNNFKTSTINFEPLNDYSLLVNLKSVDFTDFLNAYDQLQNEFPSEIRFYIPEAFHRQIIGTGGSLIQSIMRKYNVFIKFSNSYDQKNNQKSHVRFDNVIVRCPFKNSSNIPLVKNELNNLLINNENTTYFNTYFKISRNQFRLFDFNKIQQIEKKTSTFARFPSSEPKDYALVEVLGTENHSINATKLFVNELAESYELKITFSKRFNSVINDSNPAYAERIKMPFKILYNFDIMSIDNKTEDLVPYHSVILSYLPDSDLFLEDAIAHLTSFLREHEFMILDRGELSNKDCIVQGTASRFAQLKSNQNINTNNNSSNTRHLNSNHGLNKQHGSTGVYDTNLSKYPFAQHASTLPLQLPQTQLLYQLPSLQERNLVSQPTLVEPLGVHVNEQQILNSHNTAFKKRPVTHNGYDNVTAGNRQNLFQRRPY